MKNDIKGTFSFLWTYKKILAIVSLLFIGSAILGYYSYYSSPEYGKQLIELLNETSKTLGSKEGFDLAKGIFLNNLRASTLGVTLGVIPFLFIPCFVALSNGTVVGAVLGYASAATGEGVFTLLLTGIMPHGIFEIPAIIVAFSLGAIMCREITFAFLRKPHLKMLEMFNQIARAYVVIVLPLLIMAALAEAYVTPMVM